jgi:hypothetical protein
MTSEQRVLSSSARRVLVSLAIFAISAGVWFSAGILRGIAHATGLHIEGLLEVVLYLGLLGMLVGAMLLAVFVPRWNAERQT